MPRKSKYPGLRSHSWKTKGGKVRTAYYFDRRADGLPDVALGTDYADALRKWHELKFQQPLEAGTLEEAFKRWEAEELPTKRETTRRDYALCLRQLRPVFGAARWNEVTFPHLKQYLKKRTGKRRANTELSVLQVIWNWARGEGLCSVEFPASGMTRSKWKNKEHAREFEVTPELFRAVYRHADQVLRDAMDLASATGLRLTDVRSVAIPSDGILRGAASKTGKRYAININDSEALRPILERRKAYKAAHVFLLAHPVRLEPVSARMLSERWDKARRISVADPDNAKLAPLLRKMILRDMRKFTAQLSNTLADAAELLQHDDQRMTREHYYQRANITKAVR